jgi:hypothetical protein
LSFINCPLCAFDIECRRRRLRRAALIWGAIGAGIYVGLFYLLW